MSTEGILLNHSSSSSSSSRPVGGISTFTQTQYDLIFTDSELNNTLQIHNNINGHTYFTKWEDGYFGFYKLNAQATGLEKINNILGISSYNKNMCRLTLFVFNNNLYCNAGGFTEPYDDKSIFRYVEGIDNWVSEPNLGIKGLYSAAELNGTLYVIQDGHPDGGSSNYLLKTTDLMNFTQITHYSSNNSDDYFLFPFQGAIFILNNWSSSYRNNGFYLSYFTDPKNITSISLNDESSSLASSYFTDQNNLIISTESKVWSLSFNNFKLSKSTKLWDNSNFTDTTVYVQKIFPFQKNLIGSISTSFYLLTPQDNIITQYLLKGNKILVEKIEEVELLSDNIVKKDNFIEVIEEGITKIKLNKISNYNGSRTQNFLIF